MKVVAAAVERLRLLLRRPLVTSQGVLTIREGFLLRLASSTGEVGSGEASPAYWIGEGALAHTADDLQRVVAMVREKPRAGELRARFLDGAAVPPGSAAAACALDSALLDLEARMRGMTLAALVGASAVAEVPIAALVAGATVELLMAEVDAALLRGFATLKLKVGSAALAEDVRRVAAIRSRVGAGIRLRLDANRAWTPQDAHRALVAFAPFDIEYLEEPLQRADAAGLVGLAQATPVPVAVDESVVDGEDLQRLVTARARVHVVLKTARVGGPTRLLALARMAHAAGLPVIVTDSIESPVGMSVAVHVAAALPGPAFAVGLGGAQLVAAEDGSESHALRTALLAPVGPGLVVAARSEVPRG